MRRFKKKLLGWLTKKNIEVVFVQKNHVGKTLLNIKGEIIEIKDLSINVTMIKYYEEV